MDWSYLDLADFLLIAEAVLGVPAEELADMPRVIQMAASALAVPSAGWGGAEAYPEPAQKAGLLAARLTKNHPPPDGNKRVAWLALIEFVERNGAVFVQPDVDDAVRTMFALAAGQLSENEFVDWLRGWIKPSQGQG